MVYIHIIFQLDLMELNNTRKVKKKFSQSWQSDYHGAAEVPLDKEQLPLPQGQDPEGGDYQADVQRRGEGSSLLQFSKLIIW